MSKDYFEIKSTRELCRRLGVPESEAMRIEARRELVMAISDAIEKNGWTHELAAERAGVGRTVITAIVNGNLDNISTDRMMAVAQGLGLRFALEVV